MKKKYFQLFANCILTKGHKRYSLCDLQLSKMYFLPLEFGDKFDQKDMYIEYEKLGKEYQLWVKELEASDIGCFIDNPSEFPRISMEYMSPEEIKYAILEFDNISLDNCKKTIYNLNDLNAKFIEIRFYDIVKISKLEEILKIVKQGSYKGIVIYMKYSLDDIECIKKVMSENGIIRQLIIHSSPHENLSKEHRLGYTTKKIDSNLHCGIVKTDYFSMNVKVFAESQTFNSCLNQKISIDNQGDIKNCPSMTKSFGNIKDTTLQEALEQKDFKKYWNITKDQIDICKDCEFRYVCTDCRAYKEKPEDHYSKPLKCGYDPYTNKWEEWSKNPLKQKAIQYYGMQDLVKKG